MIDLGIIVLYLITVLLVGIYYGFRVKTAKEYNLADRNYPIPVIIATIFATMIGGATTLGAAEQFFTVGVIFAIVCAGTVFRDIITALFVIPRMTEVQDCQTVGDIMFRYAGKYAQLLTGVCVFVRAMAVIGSQICALGFLGNYFLDIPYTISALSAGGIVVLYSSFGGIRSVTITDVIQFGVLVIAIPMVTNFALREVGGIESLIAALPESHKSITMDPMKLKKYLSFSLIFLIPDVSPVVVQRVLMGKNLSEGRISMLISGLASIPIYILVALIGLSSLVISPSMEPNLAFPYLLNHSLPVVIKGIAISGILAVVMSTADSFLNIGGIAMVHDIMKPVYKGELSEKATLRLMQLSTVVLGAFSAMLALYLPNVFSLAISALIIWKPLIFPPLFLGLIGYGPLRHKHFYVGFASTLLVLLSWNFFIKPKTGIDGVLIAASFHFIILLLQRYIHKAALAKNPLTTLKA